MDTSTSSENDNNNNNTVTMKAAKLNLKHHTDGKVKLMQDLPSFPYWPENLDEVVTLLGNNGIKNIKTCEHSQDLKGGFNCGNVRCKLIFHKIEGQEQ